MMKNKEISGYNKIKNCDPIMKETKADVE